MMWKKQKDLYQIHFWSQSASKTCDAFVGENHDAKMQNLTQRNCWHLCVKCFNKKYSFVNNSFFTNSDVNIALITNRIHFNQNTFALKIFLVTKFYCREK